MRFAAGVFRLVVVHCGFSVALDFTARSRDNFRKPDAEFEIAFATLEQIRVAFPELAMTLDPHYPHVKYRACRVLWLRVVA
jgi:hypothetical protein